jgi:hypothetical protein
MTKKLTDTQLWILRELKKPKGSATLHRPQGFAFISNKTLSAKAIRAASLFALLDQGMIVDVEEKSLRWRNSDYRITKEGRDALRRATAGAKKNGKE